MSSVASGLLRPFHLPALKQASRQASVYLNRLFAASERCQTCKRGMGAAVSLFSLWQQGIIQSLCVVTQLQRWDQQGEDLDWCCLRDKLTSSALPHSAGDKGQFLCLHCSPHCLMSCSGIDHAASGAPLLMMLLK